MTTLRQLITNLEQLVKKEPDIADLEVYTVHGASGVSNEIGSFRVVTKDSFDEAGPVCELEDGEKYISLNIGN